MFKSNQYEVYVAFKFIVSLHTFKKKKKKVFSHVALKKESLV